MFVCSSWSSIFKQINEVFNQKYEVWASEMLHFSFNCAFQIQLQLRFDWRTIDRARDILLFNLQFHTIMINTLLPSYSFKCMCNLNFLFFFTSFLETHFHTVVDRNRNGNKKKIFSHISWTIDVLIFRKLFCRNFFISSDAHTQSSKHILNNGFHWNAFAFKRLNKMQGKKTTINRVFRLLNVWTF